MRYHGLPTAETQPQLDAISDQHGPTSGTVESSVIPPPDHEPFSENDLDAELFSNSEVPPTPPPPEAAPPVDISSPEAAAVLEEMKLEAAVLIDHWRSTGKQTVDDQHVDTLLHNLLPALLARLPALPASAREARAVAKSALGGEPFTTKTIAVCNNCHYRQLDRGSEEKCLHCSTPRK